MLSAEPALVCLPCVRMRVCLYGNALNLFPFVTTFFYIYYTMCRSKNDMQTR